MMGGKDRYRRDSDTEVLFTPDTDVEEAPDIGVVYEDEDTDPALSYAMTLSDEELRKIFPFYGIMLSEATKEVPNMEHAKSAMEEAWYRQAPDMPEDGSGPEDWGATCTPTAVPQDEEPTAEPPRHRLVSPGASSVPARRAGSLPPPTTRRANRQADGSDRLTWTAIGLLCAIAATVALGWMADVLWNKTPTRPQPAEATQAVDTAPGPIKEAAPPEGDGTQALPTTPEQESLLVSGTKSACQAECAWLDTPRGTARRIACGDTEWVVTSWRLIDEGPQAGCTRVSKYRAP